VTSPPEIVCYYCGEPGHKKPNCSMLLRVRESRKADCENGGSNPYVSSDRDGSHFLQVQERGSAYTLAKSLLPHAMAQASSSPGRVYARTHGVHAPTTLEGTLDYNITLLII
jgi:hypothetical protein